MEKNTIELGYLVNPKGFDNEYDVSILFFKQLYTYIL